MSSQDNKRSASDENAAQMRLFDEPANPAELFSDASRLKKLKIDSQKLLSSAKRSDNIVQAIPRLVLPTRWEHLQPKIEDNSVLRNIIRPVNQAMNVIRDIVEYLRTTGGCQVLVIRADTGSGKTTFLNTLPYYMQDVVFHTQTLDLQPLTDKEAGNALWSINTYQDGINLVILEGREKPESISDAYIQVILANINRLARTRGVPLLFVIPTIEEQVARSWCDHGMRVGDLIPEQQLYEGSRWYNFPGVPKDNYIEIAEETVRALNPPSNLYDFGISSDDVKSWVDTAPTIGKFIEILANKISFRRSATTVAFTGKRERIWIVYCSPDLRHYDHTYLVLDGLVQDEKLRVSPAKLIPPNSDTPTSKHWRQSPQWPRLVASINYLDVRLLNMPITAVVTAALAYADEKLLDSFKHARLADYRQQIPTDWSTEQINWDEPLVMRRLQAQNARESIGRSNLALLLKGIPAEQQRGGKLESAQLLAQYLHLRDHASESDLHYYVGRALDDMLRYQQFQGFIGVETEEPLVPGQVAPVPDITVHTETDVYALEFHFLRKQATASEVSRYAIQNVIDKYMKTLPHLSSILDTIGS